MNKRISTRHWLKLTKVTSSFLTLMMIMSCLKDDEDKDEEPSARSNRGSKRRRAGKEPESTSTPKENTPKSTSKSTEGSKSLRKSAGKFAHAEEPIHTAKDLEEPAHQEFKTGATEDQPVDETPQPSDCNLAREEGPRKSFDELMDTPLDFSAFMMNRLKVNTLTPELLAGPTFELMKGTCKSLVELDYIFEEVYKATMDQLDWNNPEDNNILMRITVRRDDDKLYTFKEGDFKRLRLQDIEDMLILLAQGKMTNLNVKDRAESYQKKLNITKLEYRSNLKCSDAYAAYSNPRGFIYQNKDKKNKLMRINELYKFSDGILDDVWTALNDRLKGIRMEYLP
ncbi:hypothetical protein Tco_0916940 [Tanacetum coccineum]